MPYFFVIHFSVIMVLVCSDCVINFNKIDKLIITVLTMSKDNIDIEHESWLHFSAKRLTTAYGDNEPEYSLDLIKNKNSEYKERCCSAYANSTIK